MVRLEFPLYDKLTVVDLRRISASISYCKYAVALCMSGTITLAVVLVRVCEYLFRESFWERCK
jgi:hypothetical protein